MNGLRATQTAPISAKPSRTTRAVFRPSAIVVAGREGRREDVIEMDIVISSCPWGWGGSA
jgi:hypothetical protein